MKPKILVISLSTISKAFLSNIPQSVDISIYSPHSTLDGFKCYNSYDSITAEFDYIFLGCKPQHLSDVSQNLPKQIYNKNTVFISVLAGVNTKTISLQFDVHKVVRLMPSLAFEFGNSFIASYCHELNNDEQKFVENLLLPNALINCHQELEIDEFTAMYGSGMGFVFEIMNSFLSVSANFLPHANKAEIITNLFENAVTYIKNKGTSFQDAAQKVTSKGGTTEAGLNVLQEHNALKELVNKTMQASLKRAKELGSK